LAIDADPQRLALVAGTLQRIGASARLRVGDLAAPGVLDDEPPFDRILLDAPCSSTGVIRRHPDIKLLRRPEDIPAFARTQSVLLDRCFAKLAVGGRLVYVTCSVLPEENERVVQAFLERTPAARVLPWPPGVELPPQAVVGACGVQLLPGGEADSDGFYYACLGKGDSA
jgi:16S rRNA (cytosine967-C5)-methyltransferase